MTDHGRVALVTGGTRGLGLGLVQDLLADGWTVAACGRKEPDAPLRQENAEAAFMRCDVRQADQVEALMQDVRKRYGRLDLLINNAGGSPVTPAADASPRFSEAVIGLNLLGPLHMSRAAYGLMAEQEDGGSIINIASISGLRPSPGTAAYGAAKAGLLSLTQALAMEWGPRIRVNAIIVGLLATDSAAGGHYGGDEGIARIARSLPMQRLAEPRDIAGVVRFLTSPQAAYISGAQIAVHGGGEKPTYLDLAAG